MPGCHHGLHRVIPADNIACMIRGIMVARTAVLVVVVALLAAACSGSGDSSTKATEATEADGKASSLSAACTTVLNERHAETYKDARQAGFDVLLAAQQESTPTSSQLSAWRKQLDAGRQMLSDDLESLSKLSSEEAWTRILAPLDELIERYGVRLDATKGDWPVDPSTLSPAAKTEAVPADALKELGLTGRDCEMLAVDQGPLADATQFTRDAATACAVIVDRRRGSKFLEHVDVSRVLALRAAQNAEITPNSADQEALEALHDEWQQTARDFAKIDAPGAPDPDAWSSAQQLANDRAQRYGQRLTALKSGDADKINRAFAPDAGGVPPFDWVSLGLVLRDCRGVAG